MLMKYGFIALFAAVVGAVFKYVSPEVAIALLSGVVGGLAWDFIENSERS